MRCHYVWDEESKQKVLIPGCMAVAISGDIEDCTCGYEELTPAQYERERYNEEIKKKNKRIKELEEDVECLHKELEDHIKMLEKLKSKCKQKK
jgi:predicted RNase H-like nuclease (RuvC/YqgF family)